MELAEEAVNLRYSMHAHAFPLEAICSENIRKLEVFCFQEVWKGSGMKWVNTLTCFISNRFS